MHTSPHFECRAFLLSRSPSLSHSVFFHEYMPVHTRFVYCVFVLVQCWYSIACVGCLKSVWICVCIHVRMPIRFEIVGARSFLRVNVYFIFVVVVVGCLVFGCLCVWFFLFVPTKIERRWNGWRLSKMNIQQLDHGGCKQEVVMVVAATTTTTATATAVVLMMMMTMRRACGMGKPNSII